MDLEAAFGAVRERYEGWLAEHGAESARAVGWNDPALQALRFDLLAQVMEGDEPVTLADFGCGTGALFAHLAARAEPPPLAGYNGSDIVPAMVDAARGLASGAAGALRGRDRGARGGRLRDGLRRVLGAWGHRGR